MKRETSDVDRRKYGIPALEPYCICEKWWWQHQGLKLFHCIWMVQDGSPSTAKRKLVTQKDGVFKNTSGSTKEYLMNKIYFVNIIEDRTLLVKAEGCHLEPGPAQEVFHCHCHTAHVSMSLCY